MLTIGCMCGRLGLHIKTSHDNHSYPSDRENLKKNLCMGGNLLENRALHYRGSHKSKSVWAVFNEHDTMCSVWQHLVGGEMMHAISGASTSISIGSSKTGLSTPCNVQPFCPPLRFRNHKRPRKSATNGYKTANNLRVVLKGQRKSSGCG